MWSTVEAKASTHVVSTSLNCGTEHDIGKGDALGDEESARLEVDVEVLEKFGSGSLTIVRGFLVVWASDDGNVPRCEGREEVRIGEGRPLEDLGLLNGSRAKEVEQVLLAGALAGNVV